LKNGRDQEGKQNEERHRPYRERDVHIQRHCVIEKDEERDIIRDTIEILNSKVAERRE
jgi:hypothetical protein